MNAAEVVPQPADFACVPVGGLAGPLISFGEWLNGSAFGDYDHAYIYVGNPPGRPPAPYGYKVQAEPHGAQIRPLNSPADQGLGALWSTGKISLTPVQRQAIVNGAMRAIGTPYSFLDYVALAEHRLHVPSLPVWPTRDAQGHLVLATLKSYIGWTGHQICSQLVDSRYCNAGVHLFSDRRWPGFVTPMDLAALVSP